MTQFTLPDFDLDAFVRATLAEDLGAGGDITSMATIPADARFGGVMDSRDAIIVAGLPIAERFLRALDSGMEFGLLGRKSGVSGKSVPDRVDVGGRRVIRKTDESRTG